MCIRCINRKRKTQYKTTDTQQQKAYLKNRGFFPNKFSNVKPLLLMLLSLCRSKQARERKKSLLSPVSLEVVFSVFFLKRDGELLMR